MALSSLRAIDGAAIDDATPLMPRCHMITLR